jgi:cyclopropane fatty-acyl-phospholipid synthase-like methyltransferase
VLELGCGSAEWAATFLRNQPTANYVAVEFSPKMRDLASKRFESYRRRVQLLDQDLNASLPSGPFDLVVSFFAMEPAGERTYRVGWNQTFEQLEDSCGGLISWSAEAVT